MRGGILMIRNDLLGAQRSISATAGAGSSWVTVMPADGWVRSLEGTQGCLVRPGVTGVGKIGRVSVSEPVVMPRYGNFPGRVVLVGMTRSGPLRFGRWRPRKTLRSRGHRCSRGKAGTRPGRVSCVRNVETPSGPSRLGCGGRPTVREAESCAGTGRPRSERR